MLAFIRGKLNGVTLSTAVIDVGDVGFEVLISQNTLLKLPEKGKEVMLYTSMSVREDDISLIGFYSLEEKNMFLKLTTVSGIGNKAAMGILSSIDLPSLALNIISGDVKALSKLKGVGKKTAERIVLELSEGLSKEADNQFFIENFDSPSLLNDDVKDAVSALSTLGFSRSDAQKAVMAVTEWKSIEELISKALKSL